MAQKTSLMLLVLYALLIIGLMVLVVGGAHLYSVALDARNLHADQRSALSFVQTQVTSCRGAVSVVEKDGCTILRLSESGYETRIYLYENTLRTQLARNGASPDLARGEVICDMDEFTLTWVSPRLLKVATDFGTAYIRCGGGGANE